MKIQQFLDHHGIATNPFADEDAQTDLVFKGACIRKTYHPAWDKIYGNPAEPSTSVVFGEKGSGKTAIRLQLARHLTDHNAEQPEHQALVVAYDDFNPFLDRFRDSFFRRRKPERMIKQWRLWDHIDAILALAVTQLVDRLLEVKSARHPAARDEPLPVDRLDPTQVRDVMVLAACYDQSSSENLLARWRQLRKRLKYFHWFSMWDWGVGIGVTLLVLTLIGATDNWPWFGRIWTWLVLAGAWAPWTWRRMRRHWTAWRIARNTRVLNHNTNLLRRVLVNFTAGELVGQPLPAEQRSDDRYEMLRKLQGVLRTLSIDGVYVLVDRVDEPYLVNGSVDRMRALVWPLLDNKLLKHPGLGLKMLLPIELERLAGRESRDFHQRARLDKQNLIRSLEWTGQSLHDLAVARVQACAAEGQHPTLAGLFDGSVDQRRLVDAFAGLRVPRHLFKFMYRLFTQHCNAHRDDEPVWQVSGATFESVLALYRRDQEAFDRGEGAG
jgi:hypothetical protein